MKYPAARLRYSREFLWPASKFLILITKSPSEKVSSPVAITLLANPRPIIIRFYRMVQQINLNQAREKVNAAMFASKFRSKREVFVFLTVNCKSYLPPNECVTVYFLKDIAMGTKKGKLNTALTMSL